MSNTVSGGIIDIEHCPDTTASTPTYNVVGKTRGTVSWSPNTNVAESSNDHDSKHADRKAVGEAWEVGFEGKILSTLGGLEELGLYDSTAQEFAGSEDVETGDNEEFRVSVYADASEKSSDNPEMRLTVSDYLVLLSDLSMEPDGFHTWECTLHARETPGVTN